MTKETKSNEGGVGGIVFRMQAFSSTVAQKTCKEEEEGEEEGRMRMNRRWRECFCHVVVEKKKKKKLQFLSTIPLN